MPATPPPAPPRPPPLLRRRAPPPCASASRNNRPGRRDRRHAPERPKIIAPVAALASTRQPRVREVVSLTRRRPRRHARQRAAKLFVAKAAALDSYEVVGALLVAHANAKKAATPRKLEALLQKNELSLAAARALEALAEAAVGPQAVRANGDARPGRPLRARAALPLRQEAVLALPRLRRGLRAGPPRAPHAPASFLPRRRRDRGSTAPPTHRVRAQARASPTAAVLWARSRRSPRTRRPS